MATFTVIPEHLAPLPMTVRCDSCASSIQATSPVIIWGHTCQDGKHYNFEALKAVR